MGTKGTTSYKIGDQNALHFITIATVGWIDFFTRRRNKDIVIDSLKYCQSNKGLVVYAYCIMSNHLHLLCSAKEGYLLSDILRDFKRHTAKYLLQSLKDSKESRRGWILPILEYAGSQNGKNKIYQVWRQDNHPIELSTNEVIDQKLDYIHLNPVLEGIVQNPEDYLYSSARNYAELESVLDIELL